jgi:hypothetical protein
VYELRIYHAAEGRRDDLMARFRDHTVRIAGRYGIRDIASFVSVVDPDVYVGVVWHDEDDPAVAQRKWEALHEDPEWMVVERESDAHGYLVRQRATGEWDIQVHYLAGTDFSPLGRP